jgi:hypothetical protein
VAIVLEEVFRNPTIIIIGNSAIALSGLKIADHETKMPLIKKNKAGAASRYALFYARNGPVSPTVSPMRRPKTHLTN